MKINGFAKGQSKNKEIRTDFVAYLIHSLFFVYRILYATTRYFA
jgi:hypothetical protein